MNLYDIFVMGTCFEICTKKKFYEQFFHNTKLVFVLFLSNLSCPIILYSVHKNHQKSLQNYICVKLH